MTHNKFQRHLLCTVGLTMLAAVTACDGFGAFGPGYNGCEGGGCETQPFVTPWTAYILKGDTVRFSTCDDYSKCGAYGKDTGNVLTRWSVLDSNVVSLRNGTSAALVPSATSVVVRGVARGHAALAAKFPSGATWNQMVHVADSSDITSIEMPSYGFTDTLRIGRTQVFYIHLRDVGGIVYRARPTAWYVTDTTVLRLTTLAGLDGGLTLRVDALKSGKASLEAKFLGLTAKRQVTVVP